VGNFHSSTRRSPPDPNKFPRHHLPTQNTEPGTPPHGVQNCKPAFYHRPSFPLSCTYFFPSSNFSPMTTPTMRSYHSLLPHTRNPHGRPTAPSQVFAGHRSQKLSHSIRSRTPCRILLIRIPIRDCIMLGYSDVSRRSTHSRSKHYFLADFRLVPSRSQENLTRFSSFRRRTRNCFHLDRL